MVDIFSSIRNATSILAAVSFHVINYSTTLNYCFCRNAKVCKYQYCVRYLRHHFPCFSTSCASKPFAQYISPFLNVTIYRLGPLNANVISVSPKKVYTLDKCHWSKVKVVLASNGCRPCFPCMRTIVAGREEGRVHTFWDCPRKESGCYRCTWGEAWKVKEIKLANWMISNH